MNRIAASLVLAVSLAAVSPAPARQSPDAESLADLPLHEVGEGGGPGATLVFFASGDGGWAGFVKHIAEDLASKQMPVVGLNSLAYLWKPKDPDIAGRDLERSLRYYLESWKKSRVVLIGYSSGADILPFMASRLPPELLDAVSLIVLVGPEQQASFAFQFREWLGMESKGTQYPILPELRRLAGKKIVCVTGSKEEGMLCPTLPPDVGRAVILPGGHHVEGDYRKIVELVLDNLPAGE